MKTRKKEDLLQLFAEGSGEGAPAAGEAAGEASGSDVGQAAVTPPQEAAPQRMSWEQIMADPEYSLQLQQTIRERQMEALARSEHPMAQAAKDGFRGHIRELERQAQQLQQTFPGFDLRRELANPAFARMTAPDVGIRVEDAYYALHRQQIQSAAMQVTAQKTAQMISDGIRSGSLRPAENGTAPQGATVLAFDYRAASPQQRSALKKRIREASARGEKLYPGR